MGVRSKVVGEEKPPARCGLKGGLAGRLVRGLVIGLAGLVLLALAGWLALPWVPLPPGLGHETAGLELTDRAGRPLREVLHSQQSYAERVAYGRIPEGLIHATQAAEDKRFWRHCGVDWMAYVRAIRSLARERRLVSGGSTITQQVIKLAQPRPRTLRTKFLEAMQALRLEQVWTKQEILAEYLNRLDYGNQNRGCAAAARFYFGKPLQDLSVAEAAFLAGLPQGPSRLDPHRHLDRALHRQRWILMRMRDLGFLGAKECAVALGQPIRLVEPKRVFAAPHFADMVLERLSSLQAGSEPAQGRVRTTLDLELNRFVERSLRQQLAELRRHRATQGAVVVLENRTGDVLALVGSGDYFSPLAGQVNGAWAARSSGSTLKPFTYLLAFERGASPATVVADLPVEFTTPTGLFAPENYDQRCYGPMRYRLALANSLNIAAVKVLDWIGGPEVLSGRLQDCGLTTLWRPSNAYGLGLTIGNAEVRLLELANAYACLARLGVDKPYRLLPGPEPAGRAVCAPLAAWWIADILRDPEARALAFGLESPLRFDFPVACKTGTSSEFRDNWALGYTPEYTVGVWLGNFDGKPMDRVSGVSGAAPVLHDVFLHLHQRFGTSWYARPPELVQRWIHPISGKLWEGPGAVHEWFPANALPAEACPDDFDGRGRLRLPAVYGAWLEGGDNWLGERVVLDERGGSGPLRLVAPLPGSVYFIDPDLPVSSRRLRMRVEGGSAVVWESDSLKIVSEAGAVYAVLEEGQHRLRARCESTGEEVATWLEIKSL